MNQDDPQKPRFEFARHMCAGAMSNAFASIFLNFNDVIKIRMQTEGVHRLSDMRVKPKYTNFFRTAQAIYKEEGMRVLLFRGLSASILREFGYSSIRMGMYTPVKDVILLYINEDGLINKILAGAICGGVGSSIFTPTDLIKIEFQASAKLPYPNVFAAFRDKYQHQGLSGLYRGVIPTVIRASLLTAAQMSSYDTLKHYLKDNYLDGKESVATHVLCAVFSGFVTTMVTNPVDCIKTRTMTFPGVYNGPLDCLIKSVTKEGPFILYKGILANFFRFAPHFTLALPLFEHFRWMLGLGYL